MIRAIASLLLIFIIIVGIISYFDLMSYTATGHEILPADNAKGMALIVYDPGMMGMGAKTAHWMGHDLQVRGYEANVSGIRSEGIQNATAYDIIIVIGPTYIGGTPGPVRGYLEKAQLKPDARIGVLAIRGLKGDDASAGMREVLENRSIAVKVNGNIGAWDTDAEEQSYAFTYSLLQ